VFFGHVSRYLFFTVAKTLIYFSNLIELNCVYKASFSFVGTLYSEAHYKTTLLVVVIREDLYIYQLLGSCAQVSFESLENLCIEVEIYITNQQFRLPLSAEVVAAFHKASFLFLIFLGFVNKVMLSYSKVKHSDDILE